MTRMMIRMRLFGPTWAVGVLSDVRDVKKKPRTYGRLRCSPQGPLNSPSFMRDVKKKKRGHAVVLDALRRGLSTPHHSCETLKKKNADIRSS
jgi:hypothetical protein